MKKSLVALLLAVAMLLSVVPAMADVSPALPYEGDEVTYHCFGSDLITEYPETQVYQEYLKMLGNITLEWELCPHSDIATKNNIYLNSGDIPDLMWTSGNTKVIEQYGDMDYWLDLSPYMDEYMPNYSWWFANKQHLQQLVGENGEIYCTVDVDPYDYCAETWFYNKTALTDLGYTEPPTTWDEMLEMARAFKAANPDATPFITNAWGLSTYMDMFSYIGGYEQSAWYFNEETQQWDNAVVNSDSGYKDLISMLNLLYSEGLIHAEFDALSSDQINQARADGTYLFGFFYAGKYMSYLGENPNHEVGTFTTPALTEGGTRYGKITVSCNTLGGWGYFASADVEHPELMASIMDFSISDELTTLRSWGIQGVSYDVDENGTLYFLDDYATNTDKQKELGFADSQVCHLGRMVHNSTWYADFAKNIYEVDKQALDLLTDDLRTGELQPMLSSRSKPTFTTEESETLSQSTTPMATYLDENIINFISGVRSMDEWDAFVEEYKALGNYDEVLSIYNNASQNINDTSTNIPDYPY